MRIHEEPLLKKGLGSAPYDAEGVVTAPRDIITDGVLQGYVLNSYAARKLGMETTGNAGGVRNLTIEPGDQDLPALLKTMGTGLLVSEFIGFGINIVTGDYSRGAAGFWVENGEIQYPVDEITVAGNLRDMFMGIAEVGNDVDMRGNIRTGSVLIDNMTIAGA
jgi:PmbA protein